VRVRIPLVFKPFLHVTRCRVARLRISCHALKPLVFKPIRALRISLARCVRSIALRARARVALRARRAGRARVTFSRIVLLAGARRWRGAHSCRHARPSAVSQARLAGSCQPESTRRAADPALFARPVRAWPAHRSSAGPRLAATDRRRPSTFGNIPETISAGFAVFAVYPYPRFAPPKSGMT
jgi:hypothetical protein